MEPEECAVYCYCTVKVTGKTGVEMEALAGVSVALLTVYDMCKALDKSMENREIYLCRKTGGKSGDVRNEKPLQADFDFGRAGRKWEEKQDGLGCEKSSSLVKKEGEI